MAETQQTTPGDSPRQNYLECEKYFMAVAFLSAQRSRDPSSQVGACIVNQEKKIVGIGYNSMPNGCDDNLLPWSRSAANELDRKYLYVCHAELNAIMNKNSADVKGCIMYVALFPCNECAKLIIQAALPAPAPTDDLDQVCSVNEQLEKPADTPDQGIKEVVYYSDKYKDENNVKASKKLLSMAGISYRQFTPRTGSVIHIDFEAINR